MLHQATAALYAASMNRDLQATNMLYNSALARGRRGQLWAGLSGRSKQLISLQEVSRACTIRVQSSGGTRTVAIDRIRGSENRAADFDCDFNPLQDHTRERWLGIASALQRGRYLPPVVLIQVGDLYFVRDGHHRISVARACGQKAIEATVEVWQVERPLRCEQPSQAPVRRRAANHKEPRKLASGSRLASIIGWLRQPRQGGRDLPCQAV
jgi:hypothetical protein